MKKLLPLLLIAVFICGFGFGVLAQTEPTTPPTTQEETQEGATTNPLGEYPIGEYQSITQEITLRPGNLLVTALNWVFNGVLIISIIVLIYSGYLYATAGGDQAKTKKAMSTLIYAIIGIAIALAARALVDLVARTLGGSPIQIKNSK